MAMAIPVTHPAHTPRDLEALLAEIEPRIVPWLAHELHYDLGAAHEVWDTTRDQAHEALTTCRGALRPWVYGIAYKRLLDRARHLEVRAKHEDAAGAAVHPTPDTPTGAGTHELRARVRAIVDAFEKRERAMLWLAYDEGLSSAEIAVVVGTSKTGRELTADNVRHELSALRARIEAQLVAEGLREVAKEHVEGRLRR